MEQHRSARIPVSIRPQSLAAPTNAEGFVVAAERLARCQARRDPALSRGAMCSRTRRTTPAIGPAMIRPPAGRTPHSRSRIATYLLLRGSEAVVFQLRSFTRRKRSASSEASAPTPDTPDLVVLLPQGEGELRDGGVGLV